MATARKLPSGNWFVRAYIGKDENGKHIYEPFTGPDKRQVEREAAIYADEHRQAKKARTFGQALNLYIDSRSNILSPTTIDGYEKEKRNALADLLDVPLRKITNDTLQDYVNTLAEKYSPKSVHNSYGLIASVMAKAEPTKKFSVILPRIPKKFKDLPSPDDVFAAVKDTDLELACVLAIWLSLRMSEVRGISKSDISSNGILTISKVKVQTSKGDILKNQTKTTESTRQFQLPKYILNLIDKVDTEFLVPYSISVIEKRFDKIIEAAKVTPRITFHDLRHLNASVMLMLGIPDKYAMERGGWSTPEIMKGTYQHTFDEMRQQVDTKIDAYFEGICNKICNKVEKAP